MESFLKHDPCVRVLVVDDEPMVLMTLEMLLSERWIVETAGSAQMAREKIEANEPTVAIVDARMPMESGLELLSWIQETHPGIVRILLTGYADMRTVVAGVNTGRIWHFVRKPWSNDLLLNLVQRGIEHRQAQEALRRSEARHRAIFDNALVGLLVATEAGQLLQANPALCATLRAESGASLIGTDLAARIRPVGTWEVLVGELKTAGTVQREVVLITEDGGESHALLKASGSAVDGGIQIEASVLDLTAQRAALQEGSQLRSRLQQVQRMGTVGSLAGGLVHEFNNLLTVILSCAGTIRYHQNNPLLEECAVDIEETAKQAADISQQLLSLFRDAPTTPRSISVEEATRRIARLVRRVIDISRITLETDIAPELPDILMGAGRLELCLLNLCFNAYEAIPGEGRITLSAGLVSGSGGDWVQVSVTDTGEGIPDALQGRIFEPFFSTRQPGAIGGTGLGLSMVQRLVEQGRGMVVLSSTPGQGTRFTLSFPALVAGEDTPGPMWQSVARGSVLLVDDDPNLNARLLRSLQAAEIEAHVAQSAAEATDFLKARPDIRVVVVDQEVWSMAELLGEIRSQHPGLQQLYIGARLTREDARVIKEDPAAAVLQKPFTTQQLIGTLRGMLKEG
ncbi:MAG: two-component system cell cycle sensor histidine kinase/response regulator CckA [Myxococcota bacterium]|jgi:two-component system cell cycle sensor histidine kinase/response regulator CckA